MSDGTPGPSKSNDVSNMLPRGLLGRKGVPIGQGARLPSLGRPRDLTLGGTTKRTYAPNIPVRKERDALAIADRGSNRGANVRGPRGGHGRGEGRGRIRTRGGRGRGQTQVQTVGSIFSEGIAQKDIRKGFHGESTRDSSDYIPRPKVDFKKDVRVNKEDEKQKLREILHEDFLDEDDEDEEDYLKDTPITLPLLPHGLTKKSRPVAKKDVKSIPNIKEEPMDSLSDNGGVKIKSEPFDLDDDLDLDDSGAVRLKDKLKSTVKEEASIPTCEDDDFNDLSCSKLLHSIQDLEQEELLLFELPDSLPLLRQANEDEKPKIKQEPGIGFGAVPEASKNGANFPNSETDPTEEVKEGSSLADMSEGYIGKLQVLKSGKTRLVMGNVIMNVEMGTDVGYLQDVVSLRTFGNSGSLTVLGHPRHRLICVPEIENIFE